MLFIGGNKYSVRVKTYYDRQWDEDEEEWIQHPNEEERGEERYDNEGPLGPSA